MKHRGDQNFLQNCRAVAVLEFALIVPVLLTILAGISDFLLAYSDHIQIASGLANGAAYAFNQAQNVSGTAPPASSSDVQTKVLSSINLPNVTASVSGPSLNCISSSASTPPAAILTSATVGSACPNGQMPGTYMVLSASYLYTPLMPFYSTLASLTLTENAVVRLY